MKLSDFKTNPTAKDNGVWVQLSDTTRVRLARIGNRRYEERYREVTKPYRSQIRADALPKEISGKLLADVLARTVVLGWEGILDDAGNAIPYSTAKCEEILLDYAYEDFRDLLVKLASDASTFRAEDIEDSKGN